MAVREQRVKRPGVLISNTLSYLLGDHLGSTAVTASSTGAFVAEVRYKPWGENSFTSGTTPTSYRFTGQRSEVDLGLYFYNARWYDPALGRFVSADTIVPEPGNPQALSRYAYSLSNPLKYTDPSGHCPAPSERSGYVICVDLFIQTRTTLAGRGYGDDRDFSSNSPKNVSRGYLYISLDVDGNVTGTETHVDNPSCTVLGCFEPLPEYNSFTVSQDSETGDITVDWNLLNGVSSQLRNVGTAPFMGITPLGPALEGASYILDSIDGTLTLSRNDSGKYGLSHLDRDRYPSLEIYEYDHGETVRTIGRVPEQCGSFFGPLIGLNRFWFNERYDME